MALRGPIAALRAAQKEHGGRPGPSSLVCGLPAYHMPAHATVEVCRHESWSLLWAMQSFLVST